MLLWVTCDLVTIGWVDSEITDKLKIGLIDPINNGIVYSDLYTYGIKGWMPLPMPQSKFVPTTNDIFNDIESELKCRIKQNAEIKSMEAQLVGRAFQTSLDIINHHKKRLHTV